MDLIIIRYKQEMLIIYCKLLMKRNNCHSRNNPSFLTFSLLSTTLRHLPIILLVTQFKNSDLKGYENVLFTPPSLQRVSFGDIWVHEVL